MMHGQIDIGDSALHEAALEHVCARITSAEVHTTPFPHCYVRDVFPPSFYQLLQANLPADERYETFAAPYQARLFFNLQPEKAAGLGDFWRAFEAWINGQTLLDCMGAKFSTYLRENHRHRTALVDKSSVDGRVSIRCRTLVTRDYADFALGPHTDSTVKFVTAIFYLPKDNEFAAFGTSIYTPKEAGFAAWKSPHFPHEKFDLFRTFPNVPNSLFIFVKTDNSFHGVEPGDYPKSGRNMLMWIPEIGTSERSWGSLSLPLSTFKQ